MDGLLRLGDSALVLGHRVSEWCGHAPVLEEDIALANVALDLIGQAEMWLSLAGEGLGKSADELAYLRDAMAYRNFLLVEQPNGDMGRTLMRQFLFDAWHFERLKSLSGVADARVAEIAAKAVKEVAYHLERSSDLVIRLGDGTEESHRRMADALARLWPYTGEMFVDEGAGDDWPRPSSLRPAWDGCVREVLAAATLGVPEGRSDVHVGGISGRHTEHLGYLLAEMQFLQRAYPGAEW